MPVTYFKIQHSAQQGYNDTGGNYINGGFNYGVRTDRVNIMRFTNINIPKGSTINSATLYMMYSGKNATGTAYTLTQSVWLDTADAVTPWLDTTRNEWTGRTWGSHGSASTWSWVQGGTSRQMHSHNVTTHIANTIGDTTWTLAGGSVSFLISYSSVSNPDNIYFHAVGDSLGPVLVVDYTPPASDDKQTMVNIQENPNFIRNTNNAGNFDIQPYGFNAWFGAYVQPTYSVTNSFAGNNPPAPPGGGNVLRVEATTGRPMIHFGLANIEDGEWYNASCYIYIPTGAPADMTVQMSQLGDKVGTSAVATKGQWIRHEMNFISNAFETVWSYIQATSATYNNTVAFYVANVQLTKGKQPKPFIDGNQTMTGVTYGWAGTQVNGFARATPPTATVNTQYDKARRKFYAVNWTYGQTDGHSQRSVEVQVRKAKP